MVKEDGKYYSVIKAVHGQAVPLNSEMLFYGDIRVQSSPEILLAYIQGEYEKCKRILEVLREKGQENTARMEELTEKSERLARVFGQLLKL